MGRSKPIALGHLSFPKQGDALNHFKDLLARTPSGTQLKGNDYRDVEALLSGHPRAQEKIGVGIAKLVVENAEFDDKCFHVIRSDGSGDNFSYKKCIAGDPPPFTTFSVACRRAVAKELEDFKNKYFADHQNSAGKVKCPETGEWIDHSEAHVDHKSPMSFSVIVKFFLSSENVDPAKVSYVREGLYGTELADDAVAEKFRKWHRKNAVLRVIEAGRNFSKAYLARVKPTKADRSLN
ncbi:MAG: hypothetical protein JWR19_4182 [Pedosphaera sp.]|nr:hypothetical protein [Pedosphaera sp.]